MDLMRKGQTFDQIFEELNESDRNNDKILYLLEKQTILQAFEANLNKMKEKKQN